MYQQKKKKKLYLLFPRTPNDYVRGLSVFAFLETFAFRFVCSQGSMAGLTLCAISRNGCTSEDKKTNALPLTVVEKEGSIALSADTKSIEIKVTGVYQLEFQVFLKTEGSSQGPVHGFCRTAVSHALEPFTLPNKKIQSMHADLAATMARYSPLVWRAEDAARFAWSKIYKDALRLPDAVHLQKKARVREPLAQRVSVELRQVRCSCQRIGATGDVLVLLALSPPANDALMLDLYDKFLRPLAHRTSYEQVQRMDAQAATQTQHERLTEALDTRLPTVLIHAIKQYTRMDVGVDVIPPPPRSHAGTCLRLRAQTHMTRFFVEEIDYQVAPVSTLPAWALDSRAFDCWITFDVPWLPTKITSRPDELQRIDSLCQCLWPVRRLFLMRAVAKEPCAHSQGLDAYFA